jgi:hypothetical protein
MNGRRNVGDDGNRAGMRQRGRSARMRDDGFGRNRRRRRLGRRGRLLLGLGECAQRQDKGEGKKEQSGFFHVNPPF